MSFGMRRRLAAARRWLKEHDDRVSFTVIYIGLALVLSMLISLFWLVVVVAAHAAIEYWSLGKAGMRDHRLGRTLWHVKLDITLVLAALWLGLYIDLLFGVAGLGQAARAGTQVSARVIAWQRALRGVLLSADDAALAARAAFGRSNGDADSGQKPGLPALPWRQRWRWGDRLTIAALTLFAAMILTAPLFTQHGIDGTLRTLAADLHPWPSD